ncbi:hypothetical protein CSE16_08205 [Solibacillus sp. R5-41]|uniref:DUF3953 domain-containing protein n=1 Tax=Solibacillus sp. R5-41 TaxID=2048654 RepID=UPI000C12485D|nr:DUF3953 domain-containing protein [Solibacillus sp. R5-41]ATP40030.1 hypothetical protein CSE16_08205 [Solibacillus sp. R5-41]
MEEKKFDTLMLFQMIFVILVMAIGVYCKITESTQLIPFLLIFMGLITLILGLREYKRTHSLIGGIFYLCSAVFILFVAIEVF